MKIVSDKEKKYKNELRDAIKRINEITMTSICKRVGVEKGNVSRGEAKLEYMEKVFDEYVNTLLKEIILIQADMSYKRKLFYAGKSNYSGKSLNKDNIIFEEFMERGEKDV